MNFSTISCCIIVLFHCLNSNSYLVSIMKFYNKFLKFLLVNYFVFALADDYLRRAWFEDFLM